MVLTVGYGYSLWKFHPDVDIKFRGNARTKSIDFDSNLWILHKAKSKCTVSMFTTGEYVSQ
jgi:hypothetical protein